MSTFQVDLRGMVDVLSRSLYSGPRVYVRELLQNAVDAITARRALEPGCPATVTLTLGTSDGASRLTCTDTGIGLTLEETETLLSTIGSSSKRDELGLSRGDYLGQFGIGLLSCFMVSPQILVTSRSAHGGDPVRWRGGADGTYDVERLDPAAVPSTGTSITLTALPSEPWLAPDTVRALVTEFGSLLDVDILVTSADGLTTRHGRGQGLWELPREEARRRCRQELGADPFDMLELTVPEAGLRGTVVILDRAAPAGAARHTLTVGRMLVSRSAEGLAPDWAGFVRVVADASNLHLTASRESVRDDDLLAAVRDAVGQRVRDWLERLGRVAPSRLTAFLSAHALGLSAAALHDPEVLRLVARHLPMTTTRGPLTLARLASLAGRDGRVRYTRTTDQYRALADVADAQGLVLVNAGHVHETELITALTRHPEVLDDAEDQGSGPAPAGADAPARESAPDPAGIRLVDPTELVEALKALDPAEEAEALGLLERAERALAEADVEVVLRRFAPLTLPALYLPDPDLAGQRVQQSSVALASSSRAPGADAWATVLGVSDPFARVPRARLVLNRSHSLVARLIEVTGPGAAPTGTAGATGRTGAAGMTGTAATAAAGGAAPGRSPEAGDRHRAAVEDVLRGLYVQCLLSGHHVLSARERAWAARTLTALLTAALDTGGDAAPARPTAPAEPAAPAGPSGPGAPAGATGPSGPGAPAVPAAATSPTASEPPAPTEPEPRPGAEGDQG